MNSPTYSIIIPHINEWYFLDITLDSILNRTQYTSFEVIVVDDGSRNIKDLDFIEKHPLGTKIKLIKTEGLGAVWARNMGAQKANGEILVFLDSHMFLVDDLLSKADELFHTFPEIDLLQPIIGSIIDKRMEWMIYKMRDINLASTWDVIKDVKTGDSTVKKRIYETPNIAGWATIVRASVFKKLDGFNRHFIKWGMEDIDFSMRAWLSWFRCFFTEEIHIAHYFKEHFYNTVISGDDVVGNRIKFLFTCFQNPERLDLLLDHQLHAYPDSFPIIFSKIKEDKGFQEWKKLQQEQFLYNDDWYFEKFNLYYSDFFQQSID